MSDQAPNSLYEKIADAQAELGNLPRDGHVNTGRYSYSYVTEDAITKAVRDTLIPKGVAVFVSWDSVTHDGDLTTVQGTITFADNEHGEIFSVGILGCGSDPSDKGLSKAMTSGLRIALCKTFLQAGDDDGESEARERSNRRPARVTSPPAQPPSRVPFQEEASPVWRERFQEAITSPGMTEALIRELMNDNEPTILANDLAWNRLKQLMDEQRISKNRTGSPSEMIQARVMKPNDETDAA